MRDELLAWQWQLYGDNHVDRRNLALHIVTNPLFLLGNVFAAASAAAAVAYDVRCAAGVVVGAAASVLAVALQGRGHRGEAVAPVPFDGAGDVVSRIFVEQWITFPRYVLSGRFAQAWRASATPSSRPSSAASSSSPPSSSSSSS